MVLHDSLHDNFSILCFCRKPPGPWRLAFYCIVKQFYLMRFKGRLQVDDPVDSSTSSLGLKGTLKDLRLGAFLGCNDQEPDGKETGNGGPDNC